MQVDALFHPSLLHQAVNARRVGVARRHFYTENNVPVWHKTRMKDDDEDDVNDD